MKSVRTLKLNDACVVKGQYGSGASAVQDSKGKPRYIRITDITDEGTLKNQIVYPSTDEKDWKDCLLEDGDILFARSGATAEKTFRYKAEQGACVFAGYLIRFKPDRKILNPDYLYYFTRSAFYKAWVERKKKVVAQPNINAQQYGKELEIPILPLSDQVSVVEKLQRIEALILKRRQTIALQDEFLKAVFVEMFGEPVGNVKGWPVVKLGTCASLVSSGSTPLGGEAAYFKQGIQFIRSQNVLMNKLDLSDVVFIDEATYKKMNRTWVRSNDVLLNITGASIGRVAVYRSDKLANVNQHVCIIRTDETQLRPEYLAFLISMPKYQKKFVSGNSGATRQALNFEQIKAFKVPKPPMGLQDKFVSVLKSVETMSVKMRSSETELQKLFGAVMQGVFG